MKTNNLNNNLGAGLARTTRVCLEIEKGSTRANRVSACRAALGFEGQLMRNMQRMEDFRLGLTYGGDGRWPICPGARMVADP